MSRILNIFLENERALKSFLSRFLHRGQDIDDVAQETFIKAFAVEAKDEEVRAPKAFLFRIAKNLALNEIAKKSYTTTDYIEDSGGSDVLPGENQVQLDDQVEARQKLAAFSRAVATLPPQCRRVFVLRKMKGLSHAEIAGQLGIAVSTVEKHVAAGLLKCSDCLQAEGYDMASFGKQAAKTIKIKHTRKEQVYDE